jgi:hypothetical protein
VKALLLLAVLGQAAGAAAPPVSGGGRIVVEPSKIDFGRVLTQRTLNRSVQVRNAGQEDLLIAEVTSSCDCAVARDYDTVVKPGRSTTLRVSLDTRDATGRLTRTLHIRSSDPTRPEVELKVEATVVAGRR